MRFFRLLILFIPLLLASCGSQKGLKQTTSYQDRIPSEVNSEESISEKTEAEPIYEAEPEIPVSEDNFAARITQYAREYLGTGYKYGGTTTEGMDCSGLVMTAFSSEDIALPRTSRDMASMGQKLDLQEVLIGDLLFFQTNSRRKVINHVGLVVDIAEDAILFIHSTTSRGVIISSLTEKYWQDNFVMARRIQ
ncbi:C40 family peptidase [Salinimicrobium catena]|uniref:C40 family peptidase n=1 Tax=Salinimicrobium catena TaxID=390640 RepID=UPI002FE4EF66